MGTELKPRAEISIPVDAPPELAQSVDCHTDSGVLKHGLACGSKVIVPITESLGRLLSLFLRDGRPITYLAGRA